MFKLLRILLIIQLVIFSKMSYSQEYYDANQIREKINNNTGTFSLDELTVPILKKYFPVDTLYCSDLSQNPFLRKLCSGTTADNSDASLLQKNGSFFSSIPGLPITNFADGAAKFLVKRFKEELSIAFFQKFKDEMSKVEELRTLFPQTFKVLLVIDKDVYKFSAYLNILREGFVKDLTNLYTNFKKLTLLDKYKDYFKVTHKEAYTIIVNSLYFIDQFSRGQHPGEVIDKYNVADLKFSNTALQHNIRSSVSLLQAFSASFKSQSADHYWIPADSVKDFFKDPVQRNIYFGLLYQKYGAVSFYKNSTDSLRFDTLLASANQITNDQKDNLNEYTNFIEILSDRAQEVSEYLSVLKEKKKVDIDYNDYYKLYNASFDLLEYGLKFIDLPYVNLDDSLEDNIRRQSVKWMYVARNTGELYVDIRTKNYSSAILNVTSILDTVLVSYKNQEQLVVLHDELNALRLKLKTEKGHTTDHVLIYGHKINRAIRKFKNDDDSTYLAQKQWLHVKNINDNIILQSVKAITWKNRQIKAIENHLKLKSTVLKYGSFAASVAQAQNSDDVEKAIESIALPAGSASIKKNSCLNISLNAYLGGFYGNEYLQGNQEKQWAPITGIYAPIGVAISTYVNFPFKKPGSLSLFFSAIDIGAFASFRLGDDSTKALPEISLKNIFAPGVGVVYGFPGLPLSLGWTWQYGPMLREINRKDENININASNKPNHRWQFFLAVDIPIVNFYNKSK